MVGLSCSKAAIRSWVGLLIAAGSVIGPGLPSSRAQASLDLKWLRSVWEGEEHIPLAIDVNAEGGCLRDRKREPWLSLSCVN